MHLSALAVVAAAVTLLTASPSLARIGETFEECTVRYGRHVRLSNEGDIHVFESGRFRIFVEFRDGHAEEVAYKRIPPGKDYVGKPLQMSTSEIHTLLKNNFGDTKWNVTHPDLYTVNYDDSGGKWTASYSTLSGKLILLTRDAADRLAAAKEKADDDHDDGGLEGL